MYYLFFAGGLNDLVIALGGERTAWLSDSGTAIMLIVLVNSLQFVGISMVIYLAGLQSIPPMYFERRSSTGPRARRRSGNITLPMLQPAFATSVVLNLIGSLKLFDVIQVLTGGGRDTRPGVDAHRGNVLRQPERRLQRRWVWCYSPLIAVLTAVEHRPEPSTSGSGVGAQPAPSQAGGWLPRLAIARRRCWQPVMLQLPFYITLTTSVKARSDLSSQWLPPVDWYWQNC